MFAYCDECKTEKNMQESFVKSYGPCDVCKKVKRCSINMEMAGSSVEIFEGRHEFATIVRFAKEKFLKKV